MTTPKRRPLGKSLWIVITAAAVISVAGPVVTGVGTSLAERRTVLRVPEVSGPIALAPRPLPVLASDLPNPPKPAMPPRVPLPSASVARQDTNTVQAQLTEEPDLFRLGAFRISAPGIVDPTVKTHARPAYTAEARRAGVQGQVELEIVIAADGTVARARVLKGLDPGLDAEALKAAEKWLFEPATLKGEPVAVLAYLQLSFRIF